MAAPGLDIDKEQVRMLVLDIGPREAARKLNLKESTVCQWSRRGKWLAHLKPENQPKLPTSMQPIIVANVIKPADALVNTLLEDSGATRLSLSRSARKMARDAESAGLKDAGDVLQVAKVAALTHGWQEGGKGSQVSINLLIQ